MDSSPALPNALTLGILLATAVSVLGFKRRWLTPSGSIAAIPIGAAVFSAGWITTSALLLLFLSSALLARYTHARSVHLAVAAHQHGPRTAAQVFAVGAVPALAALFAEFGACVACMSASLAALAFATADTWATDVGMTSREDPRLLAFGRRVPGGLSGGMTLRGTLASLAGAIAIGLIAVPMGTPTILIVVTAGFVGSLVDSLVGATIQSRRGCPKCGLESEDPSHCDVPTIGTRRGLSNVGVNFVTSAGIAVVTFLVMK